LLGKSCTLYRKLGSLNSPMIVCLLNRVIWEFWFESAMSATQMAELQTCKCGVEQFGGKLPLYPPYWWIHACTNMGAHY
jgi:hypothetical protein